MQFAGPEQKYSIPLLQLKSVGAGTSMHQQLAY
jgi:hypothetical protein